MIKLNSLNSFFGFEARTTWHGNVWQVSVSRVEFGKASKAPPVELCLRVMDAGGLRGDRMAGEARVLLDGARGCGTYRLMGGGYATLSLRWSIPERIERTGEVVRAPEDEAFERAVNFWTRQDLSSSEGITHAQLELAALLATEPVHATGKLGRIWPVGKFFDSVHFVAVTKPL